jgi:hypothetical protein
MFLRNKNIFKQNNANPFVKSYGRVLLLLILLFTVGFTKTYAQYKVSENDDSRIKWREIKTNRFSIVYPDCYERSAQRLAVVLDTISWHVGRTLGTDAPHIPVLIHTNSSKSNGMLAWAPKRMEFWTNTPPTHYAYPWSWQLAIHEYRHACQRQGMSKGVTKFLGDIFGEHVVGGASALVLPLWFMEGDAVAIETAMSPTGRGQTPEFKMELKAQLLEKGSYDFDKAKLGSRKDFVPNSYVFGYYVTAFSRYLYGGDVFAEILDATAKKWMIGAFFNKTESRSYKLKKVYEQMVDTLQFVWGKERSDWLKEGNISVTKDFNITKKQYTNYTNPIEVGKDSVLALQTNMDDLQTLVLITKEGMEPFERMPYLKHAYFDYRDGKILYTQDAINHRWEQQNYSDIIEYDIKTKKSRTLTSKTVFFNPIYNPQDSSLLAAVKVDKNGNQSLVVLHSDSSFFATKGSFERNKKLYLTSIVSKDDVAFSFPCWSENGMELYVIESSLQGKSIAQYDIQTNERIEIISPSFEDISRLKIHNGKLYFIRDVRGKYELVSIDLNSGMACLETNTEYGISTYSFLNEESLDRSEAMLLSTYNSDGYKLVSTKSLGLSFDLNEKNPDQIFVSQLRKEESFCLNEESVNSNKGLYESKPYSKIAHLFNVHSWAPLYLNLSKSDLGLGVSCTSKNLLSTSALQLGYKYNLKELNHELKLNYTYSGLYPVFDIEGSYKLRSAFLKQGSETYFKQWNEWSGDMKMLLPYSWSSKSFVSRLVLNLDYSIKKLEECTQQVYYPSQITGVFNTVGLGLNLQMLSPLATNDLVPRRGQELKLEYKTTLTENPAEYFAFKAVFNIPAFVKTQTLQLGFAYQKNSPERYYFSNGIEFTKGVYNIYPSRFSGMSLVFHTPICYPEVNLGPIIYCKRISASPFFEVGSFDKEIKYSIGSDISFNIHFLRIIAPIELGFRLGYLTKERQMFRNLLFSIEL